VATRAYIAVEALLAIGFAAVSILLIPRYGPLGVTVAWSLACAFALAVAVSAAVRRVAVAA